MLPGVSYPLPRLRKQVVYLDQMALSGMVIALDKGAKGHTRSSSSEYWRDVFQKLDTLSKLQIVACPDSQSHVLESIVSPFPQSLKRLYELLSHGVSFQFSSYIQMCQLGAHLELWLAGRGDEELVLDLEEVYFGEIHGWKDILQITYEIPVTSGQIEGYRKDRSQIEQGIAGVFARWQSESSRSFDDWYFEELYAFGSSHLELWRRLPHSDEIVGYLLGRLADAGVAEADRLDRLDEYFKSPDLRRVPSLHLGALLWASIARKAANGMRRPPSRGMSNDVRVISTLLPYCDAMFLDVECWNYLREADREGRLPFHAKVFSIRTKHEFVRYLESLLSTAPSDHLALVEEVYGPNQGAPYTSLFANEV